VLDTRPGVSDVIIMLLPSFVSFKAEILPPHSNLVEENCCSFFEKFEWNGFKLALAILKKSFDLWIKEISAGGAIVLVHQSSRANLESNSEKGFPITTGTITKVLGNRSSRIRFF
jgi:hypothetical protein